MTPLIKACIVEGNKRDSVTNHICNLSDFQVDEAMARLLEKSLTYIPKTSIYR